MSIRQTILETIMNLVVMCVVASVPWLAITVWEVLS